MAHLVELHLNEFMNGGLLHSQDLFSQAMKDITCELGHQDTR